MALILCAAMPQGIGWNIWRSRDVEGPSQDRREERRRGRRKHGASLA